MEAQEGPCHCDNGSCHNTPSCSQPSSPAPKRLCLESVRVAIANVESLQLRWFVATSVLFIVIELL